MRACAVRFDFAQLRAQRRSRFDAADDGSEDFIEGAAVELEKLLDREAIVITYGIGFALSHGESPL